MLMPMQTISQMKDSDVNTGQDKPDVEDEDEDEVEEAVSTPV